MIEKKNKKKNKKTKQNKNNLRNILKKQKTALYPMVIRVKTIDGKMSKSYLKTCR